MYIGPGVLAVLGVFCLVIAALGRERLVGKPEQEPSLRYWMFSSPMLSATPDPLWRVIYIFVGVAFLGTAGWLVAP